MTTTINSVYVYVKDRLDAENLTSYPAIAPQEAVHPFITFKVTSSTDMDTLGKNLTGVQIEFSLFDNQSSPLRLVRTMDVLKQLFHREHRFMPPGSNNFTLVCCHLDSRWFDYMDKEYYYYGNMTFTYTVEQDL